MEPARSSRASPATSPGSPTGRFCVTSPRTRVWDTRCASYYDIGGGYRAGIDATRPDLSFSPCLGELFAFRQITLLTRHIRAVYPPGAAFSLVVDNVCALLVNYQFLGDRWLCLRIGSRSPIVKGHNSVSAESIEPHPCVVESRKALNTVVADARPVLLDANKTIGASRSGMNQVVSRERVAANRRTLAEGIRVYLGAAQ